LNTLEDEKVSINIIPDMYSILMGSVKMNYLFGVPLIRVQTNIMPYWQEVSKRLVDIVSALFALIILFPIYLIIALAVKFTSNGPIFYFQERIGWHAKPFNIIKFRTMTVDAEASGPQLSSENDPRITKVGKFLRKTRLDELPQFYNVLVGQMSIVGPRPERRHFIELIMQRAPHYKHLHKVRPGITSWGQVKYGYAENVDQMIERLKFDIIYVENMSIYLDIKILLYTIYIVFRGRGK
jgi:exopolysaccharide biosynthesis polyprenyl glycosylphosphotransferase